MLRELFITREADVRVRTDFNAQWMVTLKNYRIFQPAPLNHNRVVCNLGNWKRVSKTNILALKFFKESCFELNCLYNFSFSPFLIPHIWSFFCLGNNFSPSSALFQRIVDSNHCRMRNSIVSEILQLNFIEKMASDWSISHVADLWLAERVMICWIVDRDYDIREDLETLKLPSRSRKLVKTTQSLKKNIFYIF